ncbi:AraC family transcriptional regulator [Janthinobacterium agaricidamnosum]|uniref:Bacterial regulatory helix-turn-helix s, AraC family protein n=1 Tax=Janthinobacterium agaricidamnosum NBRC 102515 = DSM 9628 TaxID=1349767 RepID=W0VE76_9BURK|nr:AraC family transcriptional regulator [Janthinobacterium agaricidamnosum]CDG85718.1 bacterial regulatory helix-turn-helix s, AraC family protein [Janthinobacterium agaricidamnosum NBRC 102515 = DSM 9628]
MDTLSRLLSLYTMRTALDVRCHFGAPWLLDHDAVAPGIAPYHLVVEGRAWLDAGGKKGLALQAGDIIVFPHGDAHRLFTGDTGNVSPPRPLDGQHVLQAVGNDGAGPATGLLCGQFEFDRHAATGLLKALPEVMLVRTAERPDFTGLHTLMTMLRLETDTPRPGAAAVVAQLSSALFALLMRAWLEQAPAQPGWFAALAEPRLQPALHGMLAAPQQAWTLEQLAAACFMSRATFARVFRQVAGTTPAALLMQLRMAQAAAWLRQEKRPVAEIGERVGYQSEAAFNRVFKRVFGIGPGQYRRHAYQPVAGTPIADTIADTQG